MLFYLLLLGMLAAGLTIGWSVRGIVDSLESTPDKNQTTLVDFECDK